MRPIWRCLIVAGVFSVLATLPLRWSAHAQPQVAPSFADRVLYVPNLGRSDHPLAGSQNADPLAAQVGLRVQNAGSEATRFLMVTFAEPLEGAKEVDPDACETCRAAAVACSMGVAPGQTHTFALLDTAELRAARIATGTVRTSAAIYSLSTAPVKDFGPAWIAAAQAVGGNASSQVGEVACARLAGGEAVDQRDLLSPFEDCETYAGLQDAYLSDDPNATWDGLPIAPLRGEPIAAVAAVPGPAGTSGVGRWAVDRYDAVQQVEAGRFITFPTAASSASSKVWLRDLADVRAGLQTDRTVLQSDLQTASIDLQLAHAHPTQGFAPQVFTSVLPGGYLITPDGMDSLLTVQNTGSRCTRIAVTAYRTGAQIVGEPWNILIQPGGSAQLRLGEHWPVQGSAAVRVRADQPIATALTNVGYATSSTHTGVRERYDPVEWAVPRAYQEERPNPLVTLLGADAQPVPTTADGWETNMSVFNPVTATRLITMLQFAAGKPPRPAVGYPVEGEQQLVFQPGFGQGFPGGPGWARFMTDLTPMYVAVESLREASNALQWVEGWSTMAWLREEGERAPPTVAIPDLGGPALGPLSTQASAAVRITSTAGMTDALIARVAIQNLGPQTARVALATYAEACGQAGELIRTIDPFQTLTLTADELPGTYLGANAAIVRVMAGEIAVQTEIQRSRRPENTVLPPELTSAYLGVPIHSPFRAGQLPNAELAVSPTAITVTLPSIALPPVLVTNAAGTRRCLSYRARADVPWLLVKTDVGTVPGDLQLAVDPARLGPGDRHEGIVTVTAQEANVLGSPQTVRVTVLAPEAPKSPLIYLPWMANGLPEE